MKTFNYQSALIVLCPECGHVIMHDDFREKWGINRQVYHGISPCKHLLFCYGSRETFCYLKPTFKVRKRFKFKPEDLKALGTDPMRHLHLYQGDTGHGMNHIYFFFEKDQSIKAMRGKIIVKKYGEKIKVVCPICQAIISKDPTDKDPSRTFFSPCKHVRLYTGGHLNCGQEIRFIHTGVKKQYKERLAVETCKGDWRNYICDGFKVDSKGKLGDCGFVKRVVKDNNWIALKYQSTIPCTSPHDPKRTFFVDTFVFKPQKCS